mmetsp:Transcript_3417/g.10445  ORF Transcript_3417/g.10445 Transcript_3417/m.10445 type:complete len:179 (-) Transcript_3417:524-1060(-)
MKRKPPPPPPRVPTAAAAAKKKTVPTLKEAAASSTRAVLEETLVAETAQLWAQRAEAASASQKTNAFSTHFDPEAAKALGDYGTPAPGSLTEQRWHKGKAWVDEQIDNLLAVIRDVGDTDDNATTVDFGTLFANYADVSDSLVGILMRAKKRNRLYYAGDMLFQSKDDHVIITVPRGD